MKTIFTILISLILNLSIIAQSPNKFSYQAVIRNTANELVTNRQVGMQISIMQGSATGIAVYLETHTPTTNANGLVSIEIGGGTTNNDFSAIDWSNGPFFLKTETDPAGGTNYTITGTSQLLSVPYALYANSAKNITETQGLPEVLTQNNNANGIQIKNMANPTDAQDGVTKSYVMEKVTLELSNTGDTLYLGSNQYIIIPGLCNANYEITKTITDIDDNIYNIVKIGNQWWMAENLRTTKMNDKKNISNITDGSEWYNNSPSFCWYNNDESNKELHGALYNYYAVQTKKLCPDGWHVPGNEDWTTLVNYLTENGHSETEGTALKSTSGWLSDGNGTDDYGFSALPSGKRHPEGYFEDMGYACLWWSSTEYDTTRAWRWLLGIKVSNNFYSKTEGLSVRCVKD